MRPGQYKLTRGFLQPDECSRILASAGRRRWQAAELYGFGGTEGAMVDPCFWDCRRTPVRLRWLLERMDGLVRPCRQSIRFAMRKTEPAWWNRYGPGVGFQEHYDRISSAPNPRVLSCVALLSASAAFDGGELVVGGRPVPLKQGDAIVFSALTLHAIDPIISGRSDGLVRWYLAR